MSRKNRWQLLGVLVLCAIACYAAGLVIGAIGFIVIGALLELSFWLGVFHKLQKIKKTK